MLKPQAEEWNIKMTDEISWHLKYSLWKPSRGNGNAGNGNGNAGNWNCKWNRAQQHDANESLTSSNYKKRLAPQRNTEL